jgi:hypothetical protein
MIACPICLENNWKKKRGDWKRCSTCGYLDTTIKKRKCIKCKKEIGKYAKKNLQICYECQEKSKTKKAQEIKCKTPYCPNAFKSKRNKLYCRQCSSELANWKTENGNLWKAKVHNILKNATHKETIFATLKKEYPELSKQKLINYLATHIKLNNVLRLRPGVYIWANP